MRTAKQKAALRKAQLASARKRKGKGKRKISASNRRRLKAAGGAVAVGAMMYASYRVKGGRVGRVRHSAPKTDHSIAKRINERAALDNELAKAQRNLLKSKSKTRKALADKNHVWHL